MFDGERHAPQDRHQQRRIERRARQRGGRRRDDPQLDSAFDRVIAYVSFNVLVFTAACVFMPVQTADALAYARLAVTADAKMTIAPLPPEQWTMRGALH